jgi:hypothetical protein
VREDVDLAALVALIRARRRKARSRRGRVIATVFVIGLLLFAAALA